MSRITGWLIVEVLAVMASLAGSCLAQSIAVLPAPGQPLQTGSLGQFEIVGESLVSAQQVRRTNVLFLSNHS